MRRLRHLLPLFLILLVMMPARLLAAEWQVVVHEPGFTLYARNVPGQDLKEFRGVIRIKAGMQTVLPMLVDAEGLPQWFFNMTEARLLDVDDKGGAFLYFVIKGMWPLSARDAIVHLQVSQDAVSKVVSIAATASPEYSPPMRNRVRVPRLKAAWTVTPLSATETEVRLEGQADPGGYIPVWAANLVVEHLPQSSLRQLRARAEKQSAAPASQMADPRVAKLLALVKFPDTP